MSTLIVFSTLFGIYYATLFPSVPGGDSGELLAESCLFGTAHPPGYPTFIYLSRLWMQWTYNLPRMILKDNWTYEFDWPTLLSHSTKAWRVNLMCALLAAIAATMVMQTTVQILEACELRTLTRLIGAGAAALFALSPMIWEYSLTAEVFALNHFILAALLYLTVKIVCNAANDGKSSTASQSSNSADASSHVWVEYLQVCAGALLSGLALSNQHASLIQLAVVIPVVFVATWKRCGVLRVISASVCFLLGLSPYYYLVVASAHPAKGSWGDQAHGAGLLKHILRAEYGTFQLGVKSGTETALERIWLYCLFASRETYHVIFPLVIVGVIGLCLGLKQLRTSCSPSSFTPATPAAAGSGSKGVGGGPAKGTSTDGDVKGKKNRKKKAEAQPATSSTTAGMPSSEESKETSNGPTSAAKHLLEYSSLVIIPPPVQKPCSWGGFWSAVAVTLTWIFYTIFWHSVLSNLPLSFPMSYGVHARFWMQPTIPLVVLGALGAGQIVQFVVHSFSGEKRIVIESDEDEDRVRREVERKSKQFSSFFRIIEVFVLSPLLIACIAYPRLQTMNKSTTGWVMHKYGKIILNQVPADSIILTHTDLDWNTARYMQACENERSDVTLLSLQMMPYPWFKTQQVPLYPSLVFPSTDFPGVSTDRKTEGNTRLITDFLGANYANQMTLNDLDLNVEIGITMDIGEKIFSRGVFLDMQSIDTTQIEVGGQWKGFTLMPWGNMYRVLKPMTLMETTDLHQLSYFRLQKLRDGLNISVNDAYIRSFPPGTWEFAVASVYNDALYQYALNLLTYALELVNSVDLNTLPLVLDRFYTSSLLLKDVHAAVKKYGTISYPEYDVHKNTALAWMRLHGILTICIQFKHDVEKYYYGNRKVQSQMISKTFIQNNLERIYLERMTKDVIKHLKSFIEAYPKDKDTPSFSNALASIEATMAKDPK